MLRKNHQYEGSAGGFLYLRDDWISTRVCWDGIQVGCDGI